MIEEGRGIGANFLLHFRALILMLLTQLECENIFGSQYALLQNKGINKLVSSLQRLCSVGKKNNGNIFAIAKLNFILFYF